VKFKRVMALGIEWEVSDEPDPPTPERIGPSPCCTCSDWDADQCEFPCKALGDWKQGRVWNECDKFTEGFP